MNILSIGNSFSQDSNRLNDELGYANQADMLLLCSDIRFSPKTM